MVLNFNRTIMKRIVLSIVIMLSVTHVMAQQEAMYTHYAFNTLAINPAYAGSREALTVTALHRSQWVGFKGAPSSQTINIHAPVKEDMGVGLSFGHDRVGPLNSTSIFADYAYKIPVSNGKLALGLKAGMDMYSIDLTSLTAIDAGDVSAQNYSKVNLNFGVGAHYSTDKYFVGLSTPRILPMRYYPDNVKGFKANEQLHLYLMGGYIFDVNSKIQLKPIALIKTTGAAPTQAELTAIASLEKKLEIGAMFRTGDAFGVLVGFNFDNSLRLGYSFDWSYGLNTGRYNAGSHELVLRYDFVQGVQKKIVSPRNF
jgi:type IX secretion system PorP/SprF family membrane protein